MKTTVALLAIVAAFLTLAIISPSGDAFARLTLLQPGTSSVRVTDRLVGYHGLQGGRAVFTFLLYNRKITEHSIGHSILYCTNLGSGDVLGSSGESWCHAQFVLGRGALYAEGVIPNRRVFYDLALTGGTGIYANVGAGHVSSSLLTIGPRTDTIIAEMYAN